MKTKYIHFITVVLASLSLLQGCSKQLQTRHDSEPDATAKQDASQVLVVGNVPDGTYRISSLAAYDAGVKRAMEIAGVSGADGAPVQQWDWIPNNGQKWAVTKVDATYYKIINANSGKALDVFAGSLDPGQQLRQYPYTGAASQLWKIDYIGFGLHQITNKNSGLCVNLEGNSSANGAKVTQEPANTTSQYWFFHSVFFKNPLLSGGADPWVVQKDGFYYYMHTTGGNITIRKTASMSALRDAAATVVWTPPTGQPYSRNLWAPEMHFLDGKWYIYFAADDGADANHRMHVLENAAADPTTGAWTYKGKIADASNIWAIDGTVLETGGQRYFIWSGWRIQNTSESGKQQLYIAQMSNPWTITGARTMISEPTLSWETNGLVNEGPEILKNGNKVFLVYSACGCWTDDYKLGMLTLTAGANPLLAASWTKHSTPVFQKNIANAVYAPGHNGFFKSGTEDWIIYHANSASGQGCGGNRSPRMQKFTWNADGTPNFGTPVKTGIDIAIPAGE